MIVQDVLVGLLVGVGVLLMGVGAVGLLRLPDAYNRANAVTKAASLGVVCVLLGVLVSGPGVVESVTVVLAIALQLFTVPVAGVALGDAAHRSGAPLAPSTHHDELTSADEE